jgi:hypothetical protein
LQADFDVWISCACGIGDDAVLPCFVRCSQLCTETAFFIGRETASDNHANTAAGALGEVFRHALEAIPSLFQTRMHRAHTGAGSVLRRSLQIP